MDEGDGVEEALASVARVGLTEQQARRREAESREAQARSTEEGVRLAARQAAERDAALASLQAVKDDRWWAEVTADQVASAWHDVLAWQDEPGFAEIEDRIVDQVQTRFGVDPVGQDPAGLADAIVESADPGGRERIAWERENAERALAAAVVGADVAREQWDSAERRADLEERLSAVVPDAEAVQARLLGDRAQATPPSAAVGVKPTRSRARKVRGRGQGPRDLGRS
jgi:hypothetical protein